MVSRGHTSGTTPSLSAFVPLWNTYLNLYENIRGQGEARKIPSRNASLAGLGLKIHPPQQVLEARVVAEGVPVMLHPHPPQHLHAPPRRPSRPVKSSARRSRDVSSARTSPCRRPPSSGWGGSRSHPPAPSCNLLPAPRNPRVFRPRSTPAYPRHR